MVKPCVAVVMRYDLWLNHLGEARKFGTRIILADATFPMKLFQRANFLRDFYRKLYSLPHAILATTSEHKKMFDFFLGSDVTSVVGDTRFDRVYGRSVSNNMAQKLPFSIDKSRRTVLILGSTWRQDMEVLADSLSRVLEKFPKLVVIIVPHEPTADEVDRLRTEFPAARVLSELKGGKDEEFSTLIVDRVGILTQLYIMGDVAYVGGGFGAGVHSVLEPAVYGMPIVTGPRIERSDEAVNLMKTGALFFVKDAPGAYKTILRMIGDETARKEAGRIAKGFVDQHLGASAAVAAKVRELCDGK
jgi:3-deoxy-D-manno-octulosonic-acid transferase